MKISFGLTDAQYALLQEHLDVVSKGAMATIAAATKITRDRPTPAATYEFADCEDMIGNEIRGWFEALENDFTRRGDHRKAITCNQAVLAIGQALGRKGVEGRRL